MANVVYREEQRYGKLQAVFASLLLATSSFFYIDAVIHQSEKQPVPAFVLGLGIIVAAGLLVYIRASRLTTEVSKKKVFCSVSPFQKEKKKIKLKEIESIEVMKTPLLAKLNGWNIQFETMEDQEHKFSLMGRNGLSITLKNGEQYFIGSKQPEKLKEVIYAQMAKYLNV
ncbi:hypothetical protein R9C00_08685 [Flammeovirgaceae bacterium SG7u.111]|nr:hypothetical protein [Flammeovirgaceae bacterium SG7u.132]WPO37523.1 hypothetical protein R9C00_08685 [Flammeovirgaceae bacterium SG7u.111]